MPYGGVEIQLHTHAAYLLGFVKIVFEKISLFSLSPFENPPFLGPDYSTL
jgi:hypothetical protein